MRLAPPSNKLVKKVSWDWLYKPEMDPEPELKKQDSALKHRQEVAESNLNIDANFTNRFAKLRDLLATTKTEDIESQQSFCVTERESGVYRKFKHYQKVAYLLLNQPKSSWMGRFLFGSIMGGIFFTVGEAIFMNPKKALDPPLVFSFLDSFVLCVFLLEFILRILSSSAFGGQMSAVLFRPLVFIDVLVISPLFIEVLSTQNQAEKLIENLQLLSLLKTLAVFKLLRYVKNASLFWRGVSKSLASLFFLFIVIIMSTFIFAILVYYVEKGNPNSKLRQGIPTAFWWAIVTLTTVGYGDIVPVTVAGKVMGGLAGVFGMLLLALPVVILGYHFEEVFNESQDEKIIAKVKENELKGQKDLNHDLKEAYFVKRRIDSIEGSNQKVMSLLGNSGKIYKDVSRDLKALYKSIYGGAAMIKVDESCKSFGGQIKMLEKLQRGKKKIKLGQVFKKGITRLGSLTSLEFQSPQSGKPLTQDKTEELRSEALTDLDQPLQRRRSSQSPHKIVKKKPSDHPEDVMWDTTETVSKMPSLMSRPSLISRGKQNSLRSDFFKRTRANTLTPKIIIDQRGTEDTTPVTRTPTQYMISSETPNHWRRSMFENPPIVYAQFGSDEDAGYRSISSLKSFSRKEEFDDRRRSTLHVANYYNAFQKNRGSFTFDRGETIKSNYLDPKQQNLKRWSWLELNSLEQFEEGDSKGSSVIIDIPLKAFKGYLA